MVLGFAVGLQASQTIAGLYIGLWAESNINAATVTRGFLPETVTAEMRRYRARCHRQ